MTLQKLSSTDAFVVIDLDGAWVIPGLVDAHAHLYNLGAVLGRADLRDTRSAAECVDLSLEEHDEVMAWVLGLSHLVNIAFASALAESGEAVPLLRKISSSTFNAQLKVAAQVVSENPHLYYEIQQGNTVLIQ